MQTATDLMMVRDAQKVLGLSRTMVLRLADAGDLPVHLLMPNGTRIFRRADVEKLAKQRSASRAQVVSVKLCNS